MPTMCSKRWSGEKNSLINHWLIQNHNRVKQAAIFIKFSASAVSWHRHNRSILSPLVSAFTNVEYADMHLVHSLDSGSSGINNPWNFHYYTVQDD